MNAAGIPAEAQYGLFLVYFAAVMALFFDLRAKIIPDLMTWPLIACGLGASYALGGLGSENSDPYALLQATTPNLVQSLAAMAFATLLFGWPTLKGALGRGDFFLLLALASLSCLRPFLNMVGGIAVSGFVIALGALVWRGWLGRAFRALGSRLALRGRLRDDAGRLDPIHEFKLPFSPIVLAGVLVSGGGWGWT